MELTKTIDEKRWWIKTDGNYFRLSNRKIIKKGQKFQAALSEIPEAFRDTIKPADGKDIVEDVIPVLEAKYYVKHRAGAWWNVFDENDKQVNEKALRKEDAEELLETLK